MLQVASRESPQIFATVWYELYGHSRLRGSVFASPIGAQVVPPRCVPRFFALATKIFLDPRARQCPAFVRGPTVRGNSEPWRPLAFGSFYAARQNAVLRRSPFPSLGPCAPYR